MAPTSVVLEARSDDDDQNISLLYAVLPPLLKTHVPKVRSLRRSLSGYNCAAALARRSSTETSCTPGSATPPPPYQDPIPSLTSVLSDPAFQQTPPASPSSLPLDATIFAHDEPSAVKWEYARQGLSLLQSSSCLSSDPELSRQLYMDATSYLLRGLPCSLTPQERLRLETSLPPALLPTPILLNDQRHKHPDTRTEDPPTLLHRLVATFVVHVFLVISFLWPYIQHTCRKAYTYERRHHISETLLNRSWTTAHLLSKNTMAIARTICSWNDGRVGAALEDVLLWWVQGVTGGLRDGVKDGMQVFGVTGIEQRG